MRVRLRHTPTQFGKQPLGGLFDQLVFGVGVGSHLVAASICVGFIGADCAGFASSSFVKYHTA